MPESISKQINLYQYIPKHLTFFFLCFIKGSLRITPIICFSFVTFQNVLISTCILGLRLRRFWWLSSVHFFSQWLFLSFRLESPTRSLVMEAPRGVQVSAAAGDLKATCRKELHLQSTEGEVSSATREMFYSSAQHNTNNVRSLFSRNVNNRKCGLHLPLLK